jgi:hypothetical protein
MREHAAAVQEVLETAPGERLSPHAARVALASLMAAVRSRVSTRTPDRRSAERDGLACTIFHTPGDTGLLAGPAWRVLLPSRVPVFHRRHERPSVPGVTAADSAVYPVVVTDDTLGGAA